MTQDQIMELIASHPDGIMQAEVRREIPNAAGMIIQLRKWGKIRRENVRGKWKLYATDEDIL